jgi:hypothetical protein
LTIIFASERIVFVALPIVFASEPIFSCLCRFVLYQSNLFCVFDDCLCNEDNLFVIKPNVFVSLTIVFVANPIVLRPSMFSVGADLLHGFPCNIIYAFGLKVGPLGMSTEPHIHDHDEVVCFIGSDPQNIGELGAEVNFKIGPKGKEEDHIFSEPTAVVIPQGIWHCPMVPLKFEKPFLCMAVSLTTKYEYHYADKKSSALKE